MTRVLEHGKYRNVAAKYKCPNCGCTFAYTISPKTIWQNYNDQILHTCPDCGVEFLADVRDSDFTKELFRQIFPNEE